MDDKEELLNMRRWLLNKINTLEEEVKFFYEDLYSVEDDLENLAKDGF